MVLGKALRDLGGWFWCEPCAFKGRAGWAQPGPSMWLQHGSDSRGFIPWGSGFRDCCIPWGWGNLRISLPSLLVYLLGVSLLYFVPLDHFGSHLSDKPFCSAMTLLR